ALDAIIVANAQGMIMMFNAAAEQMFGYNSFEVVGLNISILMPTPDSLNHHLYVNRYIQTRERHIPREGRELIAKRRNGEIFFIEISLSDIELDNEMFFTAIIRDISKRKERDQRIVQLAFFDQETGLPNSYYLFDKLENILKEQQADHYLISIFLGDLTDYVNIFGVHGVRDVIVNLAELLMDKLPKNSFVVRCGLRHIKVVYVNIEQLSTRDIAENIKSYLSLPIPVDEHHIFLTAKFGLVKIQPEKHDVKLLLEYADIALHIAKYHRIGTEYEIFKDEFEQSLHRRALIVQKLYKAMDNIPFQLYLQPQVSLSTKQIIGVEALIRWQDENGEWLSPAEFIPIAETIGLIKDITIWTLKQAYFLINQDSQHYHIAINISAHVLCNSSFVNEMTLLIKETNVNPNMIELEITETALMLSIDTAVQTISELSALGISISIDDFGTGLSSLAYLKLFNINKLKIDKSFISGDLTNSRDWAMIEAIIKLGHDLGYKVVCEGVETENQLALLTKLGCDEIQGYYFAKPMPVDVFLNFAKHFKFY
ncbi:partial putative signaling protein, partial [Patescibacteria group bacterium]